MAGSIDSLNIAGLWISWSHIRLTMDGSSFIDFESISFGDKLDRAFGYGTSMSPIAQTAGQYTPEPIKIKAPYHAIAQVRAWFAQRSIGGVSRNLALPWSTVLQWDAGPGTPSYKVEFKQCRESENSESHEKSSDPMMDEITLTTMGIIRDGSTLYTAGGYELGSAAGGAIVGAAAGAISGGFSF